MVRTRLLALVLLGAVVGCANPSYLRRSEGFVPLNWSRIAVLPFSGDARFTEVATQTFISNFLEQSSFEVVEPSTVEVAMQQVLVAADIKETVGSITILQAQKVAQLVNADGVFIGTVTSYNNGVTLNGFATVRLIDGRTGQVVASSHKPSGLLFGYSEHQGVVSAVERVGKDMSAILKELARKNQRSGVGAGASGDAEAILLKGTQGKTVPGTEGTGWER